MPTPPITSHYRTYPITSPYGRAFWNGFHWHRKTPGWKHRQFPPNSCTIYRSTKHLHAFWAGYDMAKASQLAKKAQGAVI